MNKEIKNNYLDLTSKTKKIYKKKKNKSLQINNNFRIKSLKKPILVQYLVKFNCK